jgi:transposase
MAKASIIGIDLAKHAFRVHGARADGSVAFRKKIFRANLLPFLSSQPGCVVAMAEREVGRRARLGARH